MSPYERLLRAAARWFLIVLTLGLLLRSSFVWNYMPGPFEWGNLLHAHSHTAYFGWAGLGVMGMILYVLPGLTGRPLTAERQIQWLLWLAPWAVGGALVTFGWFGYTPPAMTFATVNEVLWYIFAYIFWHNVKHRPIREWPTALWVIGTAVALLLVSTLGTYMVMITQMGLHTTDAVVANAGVYMFLQAYGDGWLEVGLMGVAAALLGGLPDRRMAGWQCWLMLVMMAPASFRYLTPFGLTGPVLWIGIVAGVGLAVAQVLFLLNIARAPAPLPAGARPFWLLAGLALGIKAVVELTPLLPNYTAMAGNRQLLIALLHLKLLGIVSAALIGALAVIGKIGKGFWLFGAGVVAMVGVLAAHGFFVGHFPALSRPLFVAAFVTAVAAAGGAAVSVWPVAFGRR